MKYVAGELLVLTRMKQERCSFSRQNYHQTGFCSFFAPLFGSAYGSKESEGMTDVGIRDGEWQPLEQHDELLASAMIIDRQIRKD